MHISPHNQSFPCILTVLKRADQTSIINGNNRISESGVYDAAGTTFEYRRIDDAIESSDEDIEGVTEWLTATGPISESIHLLVILPSVLPTEQRILFIRRVFLIFSDSNPRSKSRS